ncbi:acyltransferase [Massilia sp. AB1]|uniref:acyltransferase family protein n=1 Tax=Massilia sp. AB1 TaxID=2823371 RepID=UPI001B8B6BE8|nr:acyltransferase [Massilia sp. AB1]
MSRNGALDFLKIILALMVVGMHASFLADVSAFGAYLTSHGLFRIAVPVFLLINGYFFHRTLAEGGSVTWFKRVLILYFLWMAVYLPHWAPDLHQEVSSVLVKGTHTVFFGYYHLWYLAGMIGAAVLMVVMAKASTSQLAIAITLTFLTGVVVQYVGAYHLLSNAYLSKILSLNWSHRNFLLFSFPFFCAGFLINKHQLQNRLTVRAIFGLVCLGLVLLFLECYLNYSASSSSVALDNMASLAVISPALFMLFMKIRIESSSKELALYSTGIYLVHILILFALQNAWNVSATSLTFLTAAAAAVVSYFLIRLQKRFSFIL